jgi:hypothetical protein
MNTFGVPKYTVNRHTQHLAHPHSLMILAFALINSQGLGGFPSSPALLVAPLYEHHGALQYSTTSAHLLDVWPTAETRINLVSHCCLALTIERPISAHLLLSASTTDLIPLEYSLPSGNATMVHTCTCRFICDR